MFQDQLQACLPDLRRFALSLTRNGDAADDLVQDCVERALRKQHLYADGTSLKAWLMTLLINLYRNQLRALSHRPPHDMIEDVHVAAPDTLAGKLALSDVSKALDLLPDDQREVLLSVVIGGLSYKEVALALDMPLGTVMSRLGRARAKLRSLTGQLSTNEVAP